MAARFTDVHWNIFALGGMFWKLCIPISRSSKFVSLMLNFESWWIEWYYNFSRRVIEQTLESWWIEWCYNSSRRIIEQTLESWWIEWYYNSSRRIMEQTLESWRLEWYYNSSRRVIEQTLGIMMNWVML